MRSSSIGRWMGLVVLMWSVTACAQNPPPPAPPKPPTPPRAPEPPAPPFESPTPESRDGVIPTIESAMMPTERIDKPILLDEQMEVLRQRIPSFNCVIVRDPGVAKNYPTIPVMMLKNVTVGQFLQFLQASFPGVQYKRIDGPAGALYAIRVRMEDDPLRRQMAIDRNRVRLFRLNEFINTLADESPDKEKPREQKIKEATAQVLSLLQAALEQTEDQEPCIVKIHEPTLTLMFKGSPEKQAVLEEALSALMPGGKSIRSSGIGGFGPKSKWNMSLRDADLDLNAFNDAARDAQAEARAEANQARQQAEALKRQVDQLERERTRNGKSAPQPATQKSAGKD